MIHCLSTEYILCYTFFIMKCRGGVGERTKPMYNIFNEYDTPIENNITI